MKTLPCGHVAHSSGRRACIHLLDESHFPDQVRRFTGRGVEYDTCCTECDASGARHLVEICGGCQDRIVGDGLGAAVPWRGKPEVRERPETTDMRVELVALPPETGPAVDLAPSGDGWLVLHADGALSAFTASGWERLAECTVPAEPDREPWNGQVLRRRLHVRGGLAAVVNDHGVHGQIIDLGTGDVTVPLVSDDYHADTVAFPFAFTEHEGRTVAIHRVSWNRLDATDAVTGAPLVARTIESRTEGAERPEHTLDYFHGRLAVSPSGRWIADDGWVWHPVGAPAVWDLHAWLGGNVWESEDGPSRRAIAYREYHWGSAVCWIDDNRLAIWGIGDDDETMVDGVRIFDPASGAEVAAFAGPRGEFFSDGARLYCSAPDGLEIWDAATGERIGGVPGFVPTAHHRSRRELAAVGNGVLRLWRY